VWRWCAWITRSPTWWTRSGVRAPGLQRGPFRLEVSAGDQGGVGGGRHLGGPRQVGMNPVGGIRAGIKAAVVVIDDVDGRRGRGIGRSPGRGQASANAATLVRQLPQPLGLSLMILETKKMTFGLFLRNSAMTA